MKTTLALFYFLISTHLYSASFDCDKAHSKIEKQICSSEKLDKLDSLLGGQYSIITQIEKLFYLKDKVRKQQRLWLKNQKKKCSSLPSDSLEECLIISYEKRLKELRALEKQTNSSFAIIDNKKCSKVSIIDKTLISTEGDTCSSYTYLDKNTTKSLLLTNKEIPTLFLEKEILDAPSKNKNCDDYPYTTSYEENILYINPTVISLQYERYDYLGGAHGDESNYYINYNRSTGEVITYEMLFESNTKLTEYIKKRVKNELYEMDFGDIKYMDSMLEAFKINGYFSIRSDGLYIAYGLYEIAHYSAGFPSLTISKKTLRKYMSKTLYNKYFVNDGAVYLNASCLP